jgi:hypothetical protein
MAAFYCLVVALSVVFVCALSYAVLVSAFLPLSGYRVRNFTHYLTFGRKIVSLIQILDVLAEDNHYKYFMVFVIPASVYFVISNWVGWQYYRNS